jgi:hypothetical protein
MLVSSMSTNNNCMTNKADRKRPLLSQGDEHNVGPAGVSGAESAYMPMNDKGK